MKKRRRLNQKIYQLQLTDKEAGALLTWLWQSELRRPDGTLARIYRRLNKIVQQVGDEK